MKWTDKKPVHLLSTVHKGEIVATSKVHYKTKKTVFKPDIVVDYTENMRLIDKSDSQLSGVDCLRKSFKWYHKFFLHLVDVTMLSSYNIWMVRTTDPTVRKIKVREFVYKVTKMLISFLRNWALSPTVDMVSVGTELLTGQTVCLLPSTSVATISNTLN